MAEVKIIDIDGEQWNIKDQDARDKNIEQDIKIASLTSEVYEAKKNLERFYYNANTNKDILQNRIDAMLYCYNNSKSGTATIRYLNGFYYNLIMPAAELIFKPMFIEISYNGDINIFHIKSNTDYELAKSI